jgi:nicotinamidase-related amidase
MKKALIVVDVQEGFLNERNRWIVPNIQKVIQTGGYDLHIEATFHAEPGSLWDKQTKWTFPLSPTVPEIKELLPADRIEVVKETKSVFGGDKDIAALLKERQIDEVHIVGLDTNDCVMATAFDSFDAGFETYVIENCTESSNDSSLREAALTILRNVNLTDTSRHV